MNKVNLYADILPIKGYTRSLLFDTGRVDIHFINNETFDLFNKNNFRNIAYEQIDVNFRNYLNEYELIFEINDELINLFPQINFDWDYSFKITNIVFEATNENCDNLNNILDSHFVAHFNFLIYNSTNKHSIQKMFQFIEKHICDSIELTFIENIDDNIKKKIDFYIRNSKKILRFNNYANINLEEYKSNPNRHELMVDEISLKITKNIDHFSEAQLHHTYFNRKLYIGLKGEIKNALECNEIFGNIKNVKSSTDLIKIINKQKFKKYWFVQKDKTDICKECEFRYMCVDNRVPIERKIGEWFHASECNYNPFIAKWNDEEGYLTLKECGIISNEHEFSINHDKIAKINHDLWGDDQNE